MNYSTYLTRLATMAGDPLLTSDANFLVAVPAAIDYAELRLYRDLDLLSTVTSDTSKVTTNSVRSVQLNAGALVVIREVNIVSPAGTSNPESGSRNPCVPVSEAVLNMLYPDATLIGVPQFWATRDERTILFGPWPNDAYTVEAIGTARPAPLSVSNTSTVLTTYFPDLFLTASMIFMSGYERNFGSQADDPRAAASWETQYQTTLASAQTEEAKKKAHAA